MPSWAEQQRQFARALRDPGLPAPQALRRPLRGGVSRRFNVYRNNIVVSLVDALKATFPAVHRLVGEEYFAAAAKAYIDAYPPRQPVLLLYGETFGDFLDAFPSAAGVPYLRDVARLEWARMKALHAADAEPAGIERLAAVPESALPSTTLALHPSLSLIASRWPVVSLWSASVAPDSAGDVDMSHAERAAVLRPGLYVEVRTLPPGDSVFLAALDRDVCLGSAAQRAMDEVEDFNLATALELIFQIGAVVDVNLPEEQET